VLYCLQPCLLPAGKLAGLDTVRLIREPVAAALAYGLDLTAEQVRLLLLLLLLVPL
jgi:molecular chaperone DnaK (HSP70)